MGLTVDTRIQKKFKHRLSVCSAEDVIEDNKLIYRKKQIWEGWAYIEPRRVQTFSVEGASVMEEKDRRTHFIRMRYNPNVLITSAAWLYEARLKSAPRWFKILSSGDEYEDSRYFRFDCRLIEMQDGVIVPTLSGNDLVPVHGLPPGVDL